MLTHIMPADLVPRGQYRPHYRQLRGKERRAYELVAQTMLRGGERVDLPPGMPVNRASWLARAVRLDVPEVVSVRDCTTCYLGSREHPDAVWLEIDHRFGPRTAAGCLRGMERCARKALAQIGCHDLPNLRKVELIHDWLCERSTYDKEGLGIDHEASGPILFGQGTCEGLARALKYLLDRAHVHAWVCEGVLDQERPASASNVANHAWNIVDFGNGDRRLWSQVDVTGDLAVNGRHAEHGCFGMSDAGAVSWARTTAEARYPPCEPLGWFASRGLCCDTPQDLCRLAENMFERGETFFEALLPPVPEDGRGERRSRIAHVIRQAAGPYDVKSYVICHNGAMHGALSVHVKYRLTCIETGRCRVMG